MLWIIFSVYTLFITKCIWNIYQGLCRFDVTMYNAIYNLPMNFKQDFRSQHYLLTPVLEHASHFAGNWFPSQSKSMLKLQLASIKFKGLENVVHN